jgi:predicted O-linked N-acetylglucosamine transferase (SPINDLY family)
LNAVSGQAMALFNRGQLGEALALLDGALKQHPSELGLLLLKARMLAAAGRREEGLACFRLVLSAQPGLAEIWNEKGALLSEMGRQQEALESYDRAVAAQPDLAPAFYNRGNTLRELQREEEAIASFDHALALQPRLFQAWNNRGSALHMLRRYAEAVESFDRVLAIEPRVAETWNNRGIALAQMTRHDEALASYDRAIALDPRHARAWDNRGVALRELGRPGEALSSHDKALAFDSKLGSAWLHRGNVLRDQRRLAEALASYERALVIDPDDAQAWINRGIVQRDMKQIDAALESYGKAIALNPGKADTYYMRGLAAWVERKDYAAALADMEQAVALNPDCPNALGGLLLVRQYGGDWRDFDAVVARIDAGVRAAKEVTEPFLYQAVSQSPENLQACSAIHARAHYPSQPALAPASRRSGKIRIGYVSGEFREQATAYLMAGLYEHHDKDRFEIVAYDNGGSDGSAIRKRLEAAFDKWVDVAVLSDRAAAQRIVADGIDILVNLNGYFGDHRMGIFAHRPAPIQVNYLGFPATLGADYMDYILADPIVIPIEDRPFYTEQVAYLPDSYQVNDSRRAIAHAIPGRADCGLPEEGLVFCNFNAGYKLVPETFASWMRILQRVSGSVLWLLEGDPRFTANLRQAAEKAGVAGQRLVFAPPTGLAQHLARLTLADLFLDSLPYNAHTTASDALWAGVPLITRCGATFPGRVAASLLCAIGLPELVTETAEEFENLAVTLGNEPARLNALRVKLADHRRSTPLFDTARSARAIEAAYETMLEKWQRGGKPESFTVKL